MTTPPFFNTRVLPDIPIEEVEKLIDHEALFAGRWQLRQGADAAQWERMRREKAEPILARLMSGPRSSGMMTPKLVYGHFKCCKLGNGLVVEGGTRSFKFDFPRERQLPHRCLADLFDAGFITMQVATVGDGAAKAAAERFAAGMYAEAFYIKGLAAALAEATAVYGHVLIREELGVAVDAGERFSPGYPVFPDLMDQRKIFALLAPSRIGVALTETCQMVPEYSTSAIISIDPKAEYFRP